MKAISVLFFLMLLTKICLSQTKNADKYFPLYEGSNTAKYFNAGKNAYLDYFLNDKARFEGREYYVSIRKYTWADTDTAYFRENDRNYYYYDRDTNMESVLFPKKITMGQKWFEADSSWSYEVIGINEKLKTPAGVYKHLIVIECLQLTDRDKEKHKRYHIYYARGLGMIGSVNDGKLTSYLAEIKKNAEEGETIGGYVQ